MYSAFLLIASRKDDPHPVRSMMEGMSYEDVTADTQEYMRNRAREKAMKKAKKRAKKQRKAIRRGMYAHTVLKEFNRLSK